MANTTEFIESGTAATQDLSFWPVQVSGSGGAMSSNSQVLSNSVRSMLSASGASNGFAVSGKRGILADAGRRISFYFRYNGTINPGGVGGSDFCAVNTSADGAVFGLSLNSSGKLVLTDNGANVLATGTTVLSANTDYRITIRYTITSSTVNTFNIYINGNLEITATNVTIAGTNSDTLYLGWGVYNSPGANMNGFFAHIFVDNGTSGDTGDIHVTAKRPFANGTTNNFATNGASSGYGSGNARFVNGRPISSSNFVSVTPVAIQTEEYNIEGASIGDNDISAATIVDYMGWISAEVASTANTPVDKIILNNVSTTKTLTTSYVTYTQIAGSTTYPAGTGTDIGMSAQYTTTGHLVSMDGCGILVAYIPGAAVTTTPTHSLSALGAGT